MAENRGGPRTPTPGNLYPNRRDMATQPAQAPKGQDYGDRKATMDAQRVQPIAGSPTSPSPTTPLPGMEPGNVPRLTDPTARPGEPLTAGMPLGAGPGLEGLSAGSFGPPELSFLRGLYSRFRYEPLRRMIEQMEANL